MTQQNINVLWFFIAIKVEIHEKLKKNHKQFDCEIKNVMIYGNIRSNHVANNSFFYSIMEKPKVSVVWNNLVPFALRLHIYYMKKSLDQRLNASELVGDSIAVRVGKVFAQI